MRAGVADNRPTKYCGSIGLQHSDGVREPSVDQDRLVGKAGEDEERDLALLQRCCGSIVVALLVSTASVSAPYRGSIGLEHSDGVREPSVDADRPVGKAGEDEERDLALLQRCCGSIVVALLVSTASVSAPYRGSIGLEHSDGVREPSVDADRPVGKAGEDEERDLALFQRCCGSIVVALLVSTASVSAPYRGSIGLEHSDGVREPSVDAGRPVGKAGEDEERDLALFQRCCGSIVVALLVSTASVSAPVDVLVGMMLAARHVEESRIVLSGSTEAEASGDVILYYRGSIGLEHSDGVREPSVDADRPVGKAGEDEERDLALFQRYRGSIVVALLVSTASVSAPYRGSIGLEHSDGVREPSVDADRPVGKAGEDEERDLALFQRCCGSIVVALLVSTASVSAPYRGSIGLEHSDGVREPSVDADRPVGKAGEDEERDLALFQRYRGSIVVALLVSTASVSAPYRGSIGLEHSDGVREPSVDADRPVGKAGEDEERDLALFQRCCGSIVVALLVSTASVSAPYRGSIGLEHSDGVREPSVDADRPVGKAGEDEERDLALFQRCCGSIVVALLVSTASVSAPYRGSIGLEHSDGVREPSVDAGRPVGKAGEDEERDLALFQRCCGSIVVALLVSTASVSAPYRGSIGLEHSDGVREPSVDADRPVGKAGEDEERDLALFQRCCGSIVVALLVSTASVSAPYRGSIGLEHSDGVRETYEVIRGIHYTVGGDLRVLMNWPNTLEPLSNLVPADREQIERANGIAGN
ncbi:hypothetical protein PHYSODRAFT_328001 [Phytophthora sojae]|uniref:Uncharacterized protein n=1 Tax=Phytophthora sojae (strain P6497) TaxID=1094619 RepID=G4ZAN4_PHYSP|nr:hypothetical protein PHYSODRAFT_328001 [Phytophthora sojae]EGZ19820.1 hypothetical protein PHYSODRAFT_328001 [Phytophthora sojae]|eukprot:XP_009522537.1 hypothetical protein PHYSODRAFT_328001 [Phytophthora sojae]